MLVATTHTCKTTPPTFEKLEPNKEDASFDRSFNIFKGLYINISIIDVHMPKYAKYLQEIEACKKEIG